MSDQIEMNSNYSDLSTDKGFQFEFHCGRCNSSVRSQFKASMSGAVNNVLGTLGGMFGGVLGKASSMTGQLRDATWKKDWEKALKDAAEEVKGQFVQCPRCNAWVCRKKCYNEKKGLCKNCAPDLGVEMAAAQASKSVEEVWAHAAMAEEDKKLGTEEWRKGIRATCPKCEKPLAANAKFCPECGAKIQSDAACSKCGAKLSGNAKFCPECGAPASP